MSQPVFYVICPICGCLFRAGQEKWLNKSVSYDLSYGKHLRCKHPEFHAHLSVTINLVEVLDSSEKSGVVDGVDATEWMEKQYAEFLILQL